MTDNDYNIDALLDYLDSQCAPGYRKALTVLVAERDALKAELAALKPQSNADEVASIPLRAWVIEVFQHLCHSPHTPDEWKRDLDKKTLALLNAIEQGKEAKR
jgi:hypothetical protein